MKKKTLSKYLNKIIFEDCIEGMKNIPSDSVDLILADPPYNLSKGNIWKWDNSVKLPGMGGDWKKIMENWDDLSFDDYWQFTIMWLQEIKRILKTSGSFWICGTYHNIGIINSILQLLKMEILNEIIWYKRNAFPNLSGRRFTASHENLLWGHVGKKREYYYDYEQVKEMEFQNDFMKKKGKQMRTVWDIPNNKPKDETYYGKVASQKPVALFERIINATSKKNDVCLIPFCGGGSECIAAIRTKRKFIAFENNDEHYNISMKRISAETK